MSKRAPSTHRRTTCLDRGRRRALANELPEPLRVVYRRVLATSLREGVPVDPSALVVILSVLDEICEDPLRFGAPLVEKLLWHEIATFCASNEIEMPSSCSEALFALLVIGHGDETLRIELDDAQSVFRVLSDLGPLQV